LPRHRKAESAMDEKKAIELQGKTAKNKFDLNDLYDHSASAQNGFD
jgi:signal recognition particle GTPase